MMTVTCIDISYVQSNVDFKRVKASGIEAVIIRAGFGRLASQKDRRFEEHFRGAKEAGLKIGLYWYSYANSVSDAVREAQACLECIKGKSFELPVYYDLEDRSITTLGKSTITAIAKGFCDYLKNRGYTPGVYSNPNWFRNYLDYNDLKKRYSIWLAQYNYKNDYECDIWQNSSTGRVSGVSGNVDTDVIFNRKLLTETNPVSSDEGFEINSKISFTRDKKVLNSKRKPVKYSSMKKSWKWYEICEVDKSCNAILPKGTKVTLLGTMRIGDKVYGMFNHGFMILLKNGDKTSVVQYK